MIGYKVIFSCSACGGKSPISFRAGDFSREYVESFAQLVTGTHPLYVNPVQVGSVLGACALCNAPGLSYDIETVFLDPDIERGRSNYEGYSAGVGGKDFTGNPLKTWEALPERIQNGWIVGARAVVSKVKDQCEDLTFGDIPKPS
jgi:hypothetical protein